MKNARQAGDSTDRECLFGKGRALVGALVACACLLSCASTERKESSTPQAQGQPHQSYANDIERYSAGESEYSGFYNTFEFKATLHNSFIVDKLLGRQGEYFQWEESKTTAEREKAAQEMGQQTEVFVSFFTPDRKNDNLTDKKSIWRVFIDAGGQRYNGKAKKSKKLLAELQALYPYHTRWNTPYVLIFAVPTGVIESQNAKLTITGPLGTKSVDFPALRSAAMFQAPSSPSMPPSADPMTE